VEVLAATQVRRQHPTYHLGLLVTHVITRHPCDMWNMYVQYDEAHITETPGICDVPVVYVIEILWYIT